MPKDKFLKILVPAPLYDTVLDIAKKISAELASKIYSVNMVEKEISMYLWDSEKNTKKIITSNSHCS